MKRLILTLLLLVTTAFAQSAQRTPTTAQFVDNGFLKIHPGARIQVCPYNPFNTCNSVSGVNLYSDPSLVLPLTNPFYADGNGRYAYYVATGSYIEQVTAAGYPPVAYPITVGLSGATFVTSFNGRSGAVVSIFGDYSFGLISGNISPSQMNSGSGASSSTFWRGDGTWASVPGTGVTSFNGRTGAVVPTAGDYGFNQILGNVSTSQMNSGSGASSSTYWRGDGQWVQPSFAALSGNIFISQMNSGTSASSATYWRGDGVWAAAPVTSFNGRTGAIAPTSGDYSFGLISGNISTSQMNSGSGASGSTFWRGDGTWAAVGSSGVTSFNSRTGAVVPATSDYSFSQIAGNISTLQMNSGTGASAATYWRGDGTWDAPVTAFNGRTGAVSPTSGDYGFSLISGNINVSQMNSGSGASSSTFWRGDGTWQPVSASTILNNNTGTTGIFTIFQTTSTCSTTNADSDTCSGTFTVPNSPFSSGFSIVCGPGFISTGFPHLIASGPSGTNTFDYTIGNGTTAGAQISRYASLNCMAWGN